MSDYNYIEEIFREMIYDVKLAKQETFFLVLNKYK